MPIANEQRRLAAGADATEFRSYPARRSGERPARRLEESLGFNGSNRNRFGDQGGYGGSILAENVAEWAAAFIHQSASPAEDLHQTRRETAEARNLVACSRWLRTGNLSVRQQRLELSSSG